MLQQYDTVITLHCNVARTPDNSGCPGKHTCTEEIMPRTVVNDAGIRGLIH
jgi:hypothetical protein